jgi:hypothetical protein
VFRKVIGSQIRRINQKLLIAIYHDKPQEQQEEQLKSGSLDLIDVRLPTSPR